MKAVITSLLVIASVQSFASQELTVGDKAPALKVANWVKGKPVNLGKGSYTVVEFWATWCGPCKKIKPVVDAFFASSPDNVICCEIDVDESFDLQLNHDNQQLQLK